MSLAPECLLPCMAIVADKEKATNLMRVVAFLGTLNLF
jgi:hypothetical protein